MKKIIIAVAIGGVLSSCQLTTYTGSFDQAGHTQVVLSEANFNTLGSFVGIASGKKYQLTVQGQEGLISLARRDLYSKVKERGIVMDGSKMLVNISIDVAQNKNRVTVP